MITPVRWDAGLVDPTKVYTNNDLEAGNFMIKYALEFDAKKTTWVHRVSQGPNMFTIPKSRKSNLGKRSLQNKS